jgi:hypothetical protein
MLDLSLFFVGKRLLVDSRQAAALKVSEPTGGSQSKYINDETTLSNPDILQKKTMLHNTTAQVDNVIFDLGDVLFTWTVPPDSAIPRRVFGRILRTIPWFEYECGRLSQEEAYARVAREAGVAVEDVSSTIDAASDSLRCNADMVDAIAALRAAGKRVFAMSNIAGPAWEVLRTKMSPENWNLFERVFTS